MLLQLRADEGDIFLVDPLASVSLRPLGEVLEKVPLILHGGQMDLQILKRITGVEPTKVFDTQVAAGCVGQGYPRRLQDLVAKNLGEQIDKSETLSDWSKRPLSEQQLRYAADDVWVLPRLAASLRRLLLEKGNLEVAEHLMEEKRQQAFRDPSETLWRAIPGAQTLDGEGRAALRALCIWRDRTAQERDLNRNAVLSDGLLLDLARRRPESLESMQLNRRMPSAVCKRDGLALLDLIKNQMEPIEPMFMKPSGWVDLVRAAGRLSELSNEIALELMLPEIVLVQLSKGLPLENWRQKALGSDFEGFLSGAKTLKMPLIWTTSGPQENFDL